MALLNASHPEWVTSNVTLVAPTDGKLHSFYSRHSSLLSKYVIKETVSVEIMNLH